MTLPTVPEPVEGMRLTTAEYEAWRDFRRGIWQMAKAIDKFLAAYPEPKEGQRRERGNE